jgi:DNA-binding GntR family transcriptional regulator
MRRMSASLISSAEKEFDAMAEFVDAGNQAAVAECDTRLHGLLVEAGGRVRLAEPWRALDGQMGALMRSPLEFQRHDLCEVVTGHRALIDAVTTKGRVLMAAAIEEPYLSPRSFHDNDDLG